MADNPFNFWQELKRRRVIRIIPVYSAAAFALLEFVDIISEPFGLPDWTLRFVFVLLCIGLVIAIIFSWVYDITPEGLKKTKSSDRETRTHKEKAPKNAGWKIATYTSIVVIVALIILNIFTGRKYRSGSQDMEKTIAVLPFKNLSSDTTQAYFCDGIREEILYHLQKIDAFMVRSRTSADQYRNTDKTTRVIGDELNVNYIVEGSIGCEGNEVRIWVQLIDASADKHVWAGDFIKDRVKIFSLQSEIAQKIASELAVILTPVEKDQIDKQPTNNPQAYHAYLRGRYYAGQPHFTLSNWLKALENFEEAVKIDTVFAEAYAELARAHARLRFLREDLSESRLAKADQAAKKAMQYGAEEPRVHLALGYYYLYAYRDENKALEHLEIAEKGMPNDVEVLYEKANIILTKGKWYESIELFEKANEDNPRDASILTDLAFCLWWTRQDNYGLDVCNRAIVLDPDANWPYIYQAYIYWSMKGPDKDSREAIKHIDPDHEWHLFSLYWQEVGEGNFDDALQLVSDSADTWGVNHKMWTIPKAMLRAFIYEYLGETDRARNDYQSAVKILEEKVLQVPDDPRYHSALGIGYAALGEREKAIAEGLKATELLPVETDAIYGVAFLHDLSIIYIKLGEFDLAFDQIEYLFKNPSWLTPVWLEWDIRFKPLKSQPRFKELVAKFNKENNL